MAGENVINLVNSGFCRIEGWSIELNHAGQGIAVGTNAVGKTRISTQNILKDLLLWQNIKSTDLQNFVSVELPPFDGDNNEFMSFENITCNGAYNSDLTNAVATGFAYGTNSNCHFHVVKNCQVFGAHTGFFTWNNLRFEGFNSASFCQYAVQCSGLYGTDINYLDCENTWTIIKGLNFAATTLTTVRNGRFASCGMTGRALFDFTSYGLNLQIEGCGIDLATVISTGGYLFDVTGGTLSGVTVTMAKNLYVAPPAAAPASLVHGIDLNSLGSGITFVAEYDAFFDLHDFMSAHRQKPPSTSPSNGLSLGVPSLDKNLFGGSIASGAVTVQGTGAVFPISIGDASTLININLAANNGIPPTPYYLFWANGGSITIGNSGNINYSGTLAQGAYLALWWDGAKWQHPT